MIFSKHSWERGEALVTAANIPEDAFRSFVVFVPFPELVRLRLVCKHFRSLLLLLPCTTRFKMGFHGLKSETRHVTFFKKMVEQSEKISYLDWFVAADNDAFLEYLSAPGVNFCEHLVDFTFDHGNKAVRSLVFINLAKTVGGLKRLTLKHCFEPSTPTSDNNQASTLDVHLLAIARANPIMESITLKHCSVTNALFASPVFLDSFAHLQEFSLKYNPDIDGSILEVLAQLPHLQKIVLGGCERLKEESVRRFLQLVVSNIQVLKIQWFTEDPEGLKPSAKFVFEFAAHSPRGRFLREISLKWAGDVTAESLFLLVRHPSLQRLHLKMCGVYTRNEQENIELHHVLSLLRRQGVNVYISEI